MSVYLRHRNTIWMLVKDFPLRCLVKNALWILAGQVGTLAWNSLGPGWRPVLKGKIDGVRGILRMWRKRRASGSGGTCPEIPLDGRLFLLGRRGQMPFAK